MARLRLVHYCRCYPLPPQGPAPSGVSRVDAVEPVEVAADSGASGGAEPERAEPGGAGSGGAEPECAEPGGAGSGGAEPERAEPGGAVIGGVEPADAGPGGPSGVLSRRELPSPQELCEWFARRWSRAAARVVSSLRNMSNVGVLSHFPPSKLGGRHADDDDVQAQIQPRTQVHHSRGLEVAAEVGVPCTAYLDFDRV
ncbi:unnamed protein product [Closterium sp. NIES-53]